MPKPKNPSASAKATADKSAKPVKKTAVKKTAIKKAIVSKVKKTAAAKPTDKIEKYVTEQRYLILKSLDDGKAEDILDFDLRGVSSLADYMVIASGRSTRQVASLAENISKALKAAGHKILSREGQSTNDWVIVDTGDIIVHILRPEVRAYYRLEEIWGKTK
jgi:ribosome-associated protein